MPLANGRRVAITGLGFVTPLGSDAETVWSSLVEGASGVGPITLFDAHDFPTRIAAEVKGFVPEDFMDGKKRSQFIPLLPIRTRRRSERPSAGEP